MENYQDKYSTFTLSLAAAIITATGLQPSLIDWQTHKAEFVFDANDSFDSVIKAFWERKLACDCLTYFENLRALKSRLYEEKHVG